MADFEFGTSHFAASAIAVADALALPLNETVQRNFRWLEADRRSFTEAVEFESWIDARGLPPELSPAVRSLANKSLGEWHTALPYTEGERRLVFDDGCFAGNPELVRALGRSTIFDAGLEKEVAGRELIQRWFKWRRASDEFEGTDGIRRARTALHQFADLLLGEQLPPFEG